MATKLSFTECVIRVKKINDDLLAKGLNWDEIDKFWKDIFTLCESLNNKKIEKVEVFKFEKHGN